MNLDCQRCLADMAHATAWLNFTTASANHDLQEYGQWRMDYASQASYFQSDYEKAAREFIQLTSSKIDYEELNASIKNIGDEPVSMGSRL